MKTTCPVTKIHLYNVLSFEQIILLKLLVVHYVYATKASIDTIIVMDYQR